MNTTQTAMPLVSSSLQSSVIDYCRSIEQQLRKSPHIYPQFVKIFNDFANGWIDVVSLVKRISVICTEEPLLVYGFTPFLSPELEIARIPSGQFVVTPSTSGINYWDICISPFVRYIHGRVRRHGNFAVTGGGFADIWTGTFENTKVAIKMIRRFGNISKYSIRLWRECCTWGNLSHPNILPLLGVCLEPISETTIVPCLVSPWMDNGTLNDYIIRNPKVDRVRLLAGIVEGIRYLHTRTPPVVHGDLRAGNVLVSSDGTPCLSDFGLSRMLLETGGMTTTTVAGSTRWMSPELLEEHPVTTDSDVWAFGMTIIEVLTGKPPYQEVKNQSHVFQHIVKGHLPLQPNEVDDGFWQIVQDCCAYNPLERHHISSVVDQISEVVLEEAATQQWWHGEWGQQAQPQGQPQLAPRDYLFGGVAFSPGQGGEQDNNSLHLPHDNTALYGAQQHGFTTTVSLASPEASSTFGLMSLNDPIAVAEMNNDASDFTPGALPDAKVGSSVGKIGEVGLEGLRIEEGTSGELGMGGGMGGEGTVLGGSMTPVEAGNTSELKDFWKAYMRVPKEQSLSTTGMATGGEGTGARSPHEQGSTKAQWSGQDSRFTAEHRSLSNGKLKTSSAAGQGGGTGKKGADAVYDPGFYQTNGQNNLGSFQMAVMARRSPTKLKHKLIAIPEVADPP